MGHHREDILETVMQMVIGHMLYLMEDVDGISDDRYHVFMKKYPRDARIVVQLPDEDERQRLDEVVKSGDIVRAIEFALAEDSAELEVHFMLHREGMLETAKSMLGDISNSLEDVAVKAHNWITKGHYPIDPTAPKPTLH